jgi:TetR/AcrR family transcriptional regulator, regulator of autoinduction and epiphytic fitness
VVKVPGERLDPRQARTRARVYAAALEVLRREGIGATTFDAIAQQAGVARSTLYRNWASRDDLLLEAIEEQAPFPAALSGEPTLARLEAALQEIGSALSTSSWGWILPAALAATDASPFLSGRYLSFITALRAVFTTIVDDGKKAGELPPALDDDDFADALIGPLFFRRLIRKLPADPTWIRNHLQRTLAAFGADPSTAGETDAPLTALPARHEADDGVTRDGVPAHRPAGAAQNRTIGTPRRVSPARALGPRRRTGRPGFRRSG